MQTTERPTVPVILCCADCASINVDTTVWVRGITGAETGDDCPLDYGWCDECGENVSLDVHDDPTPEQISLYEHGHQVAALKHLRRELPAMYDALVQSGHIPSMVQAEVEDPKWSIRDDSNDDTDTEGEGR